ncbi:hypothetical protein FOA52_002526 [Chlamydomonas sp. UWO 241]|nr:hypothetical protein FOA52_002526 [Chlamydomonas sp. UWO 241]
MAHARTLRVSVLGVKVPEARKYHIALQVLAPGQLPTGVVGLTDAALDGTRPAQVARTETSPMSPNPEFLNRVFIMRLPEPIGQRGAPSFQLQCNLFAAPSIGYPSGPMVAGQEVDELMGAATMQVGGDVAARLLRGERVTLPVLLGSSDADTQASTAGMFGRSSREVLLELLFLDADVALPRDRFGAQARNEAAAETAAEATLLVLVHRAANLPLVRGDGPKDAEPSTFVAASTVSDARGSKPPQCVTRVAGSRSPEWNQLLQVRVREDELGSEKLHLAIVNDANSKMMLKCAVPLGNLLPGLHYNLRLKLQGGPLDSRVSLDVTLCLTAAPRRQIRAFKQAASARPDTTLMVAPTVGQPPAPPPPHPGASLFAVWRLEPHQSGGAGEERVPTAPPSTAGSAASGGAPARVPATAGSAASGGAPARAPATPTPAAGAPPPLDAGVLLRTVEADSEDAVASAISKMSETFTSAATAGVQGFAGVAAGGILDVVPLGPAGSSLWPADHAASLTCSPTPDSDLVMELHTIDGPEALASTATGWMRVSWRDAVASKARLDGSTIRAESPACVTAGGSLAGSRPSVDMCVWSAQEFEGYLSRRVDVADKTADAARSVGLGAGPMQWQDRGAGGGEGGAAMALLETLADDMVLKQVAIERVVRACEMNEARCEMAVWRLQDAENAKRKLSADCEQLRQIVHEEKEARRLPQVLENSAGLSKEEVVERAEAALSAYGRERRRNAELVHRLQQMHGEQVDTLELKKRFHELQTAHMIAQKMATEEGSFQGQLSMYRAAIKTQEEVSSNLEKLLSQAVRQARGYEKKAKELKKSLASARGESQREVDDMRSQMDTMSQHQSRPQSERMDTPPPRSAPDAKPGSAPDAEEVKDLRKQLEEAKRELQDARTDADDSRTGGMDAQREIMDLQLQLKQTQDRAEAIQSETVEAIKRYARETSDLKCKLAEKDAALMGGFGDMHRLRDPDDDLGIPMVTMPTSQGSQRGHANHRQPRAVSAEAHHKPGPSGGNGLNSPAGSDRGSPRAHGLRTSSGDGNGSPSTPTRRGGAPNLAPGVSPGGSSLSRSARREQAHDATRTASDYEGPTDGEADDGDDDDVDITAEGITAKAKSASSNANGSGSKTGSKTSTPGGSRKNTPPVRK